MWRNVGAAAESRVGHWAAAVADVSHYMPRLTMCRCWQLCGISPVFSVHLQQGWEPASRLGVAKGDYEELAMSWLRDQKSQIVSVSCWTIARVECDSL